MAGISSASLDKALTELEAKLPTATLPLAEELFDVLAVIDSSAGLRRALTDPARTGADKSALVKTLVGSTVSVETVAIVASLAASRWAAARDIGDALETLAAMMVIAVAENKTANGGTGGGINSLERLEDDLFSFNQVVAAYHDVQRALGNGAADNGAKAALALKLVPDASEEARLLIGRAVTQPRGLKPTALVERFIGLVARRQERWIAVVSASRPLDEQQLARLQAGLNALYGRELKTNVVLDPSLVGGLRVRVGAEVVDASVLTRLTDLRRQMAG